MALSNDRKLKNINFSFIDKITKQSRTVNLIEHDNIDIRYYGKNNKITHTYGEIIKIGEYADGRKYILVLDYDYYAEENVHSIDLTKIYTIINVVHSNLPYSFSPVYCADETVALVKAQGESFFFTTDGKTWVEVHGGGSGVTRREVEEMIEEATSDLATEEFVSESIETAIEPLATKDELDTAIEEVKEKVVGAFHFRGKVDTREELDNIEDPEDGDVYEVLETNSEFAYNGKDSEWIELGSVFDLSDYSTTEEADARYDMKGSADSAETAAKSYADSHFDLKGAAAEALQDAKDYADSNFDSKGAAAQAFNDAKYYADTVGEATLQDAKFYAEENFDPIGSAANAVVTANEYTDEQIRSIDVYQLCVEKGYEGTEDEFYTALADIVNHHNVITTTIQVDD